MINLDKKDIDRFWSKVNVKLHDWECWDWTGTILNTGYGQIKIKGKKLVAHRISYELKNGKIPKGLVIDHLCRNTICCNPHHLQAVTNKENILRGEGICAKESKQTNCKRGHELTKDNYYITNRGGRQCKKCTKLRSNNQSKSESN